MPPKRISAAAKKSTASPWYVPLPVTWMVLFLCLVLACLSITTFKKMRASAVNMSKTINNLQTERAHARTLLTIERNRKPAPVPKALPPVLTSVVKFHPGELESMQLNLVNPLMAFYADEPAAHALTAMLIERKIPSSTNVNVRLFFADGTETSYLWPNTHAKNGIWTPPCARDSASVTPELPLCVPDLGSATASPTTPVQQ